MRKLYTIVLLLIFLVIFSLNFNFNFKEIKKIGDSPVYKAVFSKTEEQRASLPALVIIYDDGFIEDYSRAFYIHRKLDVPAVAAVNPECIGREGRLGLEHLQEMEAAGWEIASHGQFHAAFIYNQVIKTAARGATGLYVKHPELIEKRYRYVLFNSDSGVSETITIANIRRDGGQTYLKLEKPLAHDYPTSRTYIMLAKSALKHELL
ncbi:MAG: hypothetical protein ACOCQN_03990, partial [Halanaerobiaceae bacterium]